MLTVPQSWLGAWLGARLLLASLCLVFNASFPDLRHRLFNANTCHSLWLCDLVLVPTAPFPPAQQVAFPNPPLTLSLSSLWWRHLLTLKPQSRCAETCSAMSSPCPPLADGPVFAKLGTACLQDASDVLFNLWNPSFQLFPGC